MRANPFSLLNLPKLTSAWTSGRCLHHVNELAEFMVVVLGRIGDRDTVDVLKCVADDPVLGKSAIAAIASINHVMNILFWAFQVLWGIVVFASPTVV
jgi:hypothetical protein